MDAGVAADYWSNVGVGVAAGAGAGARREDDTEGSLRLDPLPFLVNGPSTASVPAHARAAWRRIQPDLAGLVEGQEQDVALLAIDRLLWGLVVGGTAGDRGDTAATDDSSTSTSSSSTGEKGTGQEILPRKDASARPPSFVRELMLRWV